MTYVDQGTGEVILSIHGIFGGYDQAFDTCKDKVDDFRIIAPSRFGYLESDILGDGTPAEQAEVSFDDMEKAAARFPDCTFVSFETGGHLMSGHSSEINKALLNFTNR